MERSGHPADLVGQDAPVAVPKEAEDVAFDSLSAVTSKKVTASWDLIPTQPPGTGSGCTSTPLPTSSSKTTSTPVGNPAAAGRSRSQPRRVQGITSCAGSATTGTPGSPRPQTMSIAIQIDVTNEDGTSVWANWDRGLGNVSITVRVLSGLLAFRCPRKRSAVAVYDQLCATSATFRNCSGKDAGAGGRAHRAGNRIVVGTHVIGDEAS
jgi:hypothetical protein